MSDDIQGRRAQTETHKRLIDAVNTLASYVEQHLPSMWEIRIGLMKGEATCDLINPAGESVYQDCADQGVSTIGDMCESAWETEADRIFDVPFVFWTCPEGCNGCVEWNEEKTDAICKVCGTRRNSQRIQHN